MFSILYDEQLNKLLQAASKYHQNKKRQNKKKVQRYKGCCNVVKYSHLSINSTVMVGDSPVVGEEEMVCDAVCVLEGQNPLGQKEEVPYFSISIIAAKFLNLKKRKSQFI